MPEMRDRIPDPTDEQAFLLSKLDWGAIEDAPRAEEFRALTRELLSVRHRRITPLIKEGFVQAKAELLGRARAPKERSQRYLVDGGEKRSSDYHQLRASRFAHAEN